jgi:integrase
MLRVETSYCRSNSYVKINQSVDMTSAFIDIFEGTKGGRARTVEMIQARKEETIAVILQSLAYAKDNSGHLLVGNKLGLKAARSIYHYLCIQAGLVGEISMHSLRYLYATEKLQELKAQGFTRKEAGQWVARSLGHEASRDRYVRRVYGCIIVTNE